MTRVLERRLPESLRQVAEAIRESQPHWSTRSCPDCGAVPVVRGHSASMRHHKVGCRTPEERTAERTSELAWMRIHGRWV